MFLSKKLITKYLLFITLVCSMGILGYMLYNLKFVEESLIVTSFSQQENEVKDKLDKFFLPIHDLLEIAVQSGVYGNFNNLEMVSFDKMFMPVLDISPSISSIMLANSYGEELMLLKTGNFGFNRETVVTDTGLTSKFYKWEKHNNGMYFQQLDDMRKSYDPKVRPWFTGAMMLGPENVHWTQPYEFFTTKDLGITLSKNWITESGDTNILAFDIMLRDISKYTTQLEIYENGKVFILTEDSKLLGFPKDDRYNSQDSIKKDMLKPISQLPLDLLRKAGEKWEKLNKTNVNYNIRVGGEKWVCSIRPYSLNNIDLFIGVVALKSDFQAEFRKARILMMGGQLLILIFMVNMIRGYRQKRKSNILLRQRKNLLEQVSSKVKFQHDLIQRSHLNTMDSIKYAKRIQKALMSPKELKAQLFPDSFVLLMPKDVVSGDFYWYDKSNGKKFIAAVDCTGHGVPGALMSMLGHTFLEEAVVKEGIMNPAEILDKIRELVINALKQSEDSRQRDGMDMALLCFDEKMSSVSYAGAKNPLYLIREGKLEIIKADSMGVGFEYQPLSPFNNNEIKLKKGDVLYIFTDGFADQFGGSKNRKYMYSRFRKFLVSIHELPMPEQENQLISEFENWKGKNQQLDDICIIGIRV